MSDMKHQSLFSGIGGFEIAAEWMGWENISHTEINEFGRKVLNHHYPNAKSHGDITTTDYTIYRGRVDIVTGGFPCQPYSVAGKRKGKDDERHLWPEMLRAIRQIAPRWVVGENVRGIINWDAGVVFNEVQADLEAEGYEILPFLLPAASVNAPHERYRTWFVAYSHDKGNSSGLRPVPKENGEIPERNQDAEFSNTGDGVVTDTNKIKCRGWRTESDRQKSDKENGEVIQFRAKRFGIQQSSANSHSERQQECNDAGQPSGARRQPHKAISPLENFRNFPTQSPVCNGDDGFSTRALRQRIREDSMGIISEEEIDKILSTAYNQWRNETIKAGGNAVVPPLVLQIFKAIELYELS